MNPDGPPHDIDDWSWSCTPAGGALPVPVERPFTPARVLQAAGGGLGGKGAIFEVPWAAAGDNTPGASGILGTWRGMAAAGNSDLPWQQFVLLAHLLPISAASLLLPASPLHFVLSPEFQTTAGVSDHRHARAEVRCNPQLPLSSTRCAQVWNCPWRPVRPGALFAVVIRRAPKSPAEMGVLPFAGAVIRRRLLAHCESSCLEMQELERQGVC